MFDVNSHLIDLKGKAYLQVAWRLVWFREEHPEWCIETQMVDHDKTLNSAVFRATIRNGEGLAISSGYGSESMKDFRDYLEKAETKAVGRALAMLGYGTQFAPEMDEGERIVDSPIQKPRKAFTTEEAAAYVLNSGAYVGCTLGEVFKRDLPHVKELYYAADTDPQTKAAIDVLLKAVRAANGR